MEAIILGWYILVETKSVLMLTLFASLQYIGTLLAPMFGVMGHRLGNRNVLAAMRATYATLAATLMTLSLTGVLVPAHVFVIVTLMGMVRPSDLVMRYGLIGETMTGSQLMGATSISRTTQDSARIMGSLAGAAIVAALGMGPAYVVITCLYVTSLLLTLRVNVVRHTVRAGEGEAKVKPPATSPLRDLKDGVIYVWNTPQMRAGMYLAFLVNLCAFPLVMGLMPYVAKEIYHTDQTGLGYLIASWATGALVGSITLSRIGHAVRPARTMLIFGAVWYMMLIIFTFMPTPAWGSLFLFFAGFAQSLSMVSLSAMLLRNSAPEFRSRVMGLRMLMIYGVPIGLLTAGQLIGNIGYAPMCMLYGLFGIACTLMIAVRWRKHVWRSDAPANAR
jgi:predicted MFS family arabinose efflux permease